jgi:hypothetical protein
MLSPKRCELVLARVEGDRQTFAACSNIVVSDKAVMAWLWDTPTPLACRTSDKPRSEGRIVLRYQVDLLSPPDLLDAHIRRLPSVHRTVQSNPCEVDSIHELPHQSTRRWKLSCRYWMRLPWLGKLAHNGLRIRMMAHVAMDFT